MSSLNNFAPGVNVSQEKWDSIFKREPKIPSRRADDPWIAILRKELQFNAIPMRRKP